MSRTGTARLFAAVDLPGGLAEELAAWARSAVRAVDRKARAAARVRALDAGLLHLTLCFLGERPVEEIDALAAALGGCVGPVGRLETGGPVWLPPRHPHALAVQIGDRDGRLSELQTRVSAALAGSGPERRRFRAHVTVARMRAGSVGTATQLEPTPARPFTPLTISLYRSWLGREGASYERLAACGLPELPGTDPRSAGA